MSLFNELHHADHLSLIVKAIKKERKNIWEH